MTPSPLIHVIPHFKLYHAFPYIIRTLSSSHRHLGFQLRPGHYFERMPNAFSPMRSPIFLASALSSSEMSLKEAASWCAQDLQNVTWRFTKAPAACLPLPLTFWLYVIHAMLLHSCFRPHLAGRLKLGLLWECFPLTRAAQWVLTTLSIIKGLKHCEKLVNPEKYWVDCSQLVGQTSLGHWKLSVYQRRIAFIGWSFNLKLVSKSSN